MNYEERRRHPLYRRWTHAKSVVSNPKLPDYKAGLDIDGHTDFEYFAHWVTNEIGPPPQPNSKLNRIDQHKGWVKGNLRWTDQRGVGRNVPHMNHIVNYQGKDMCLQDLADLAGITYGTAFSRWRRGWRIEDIVKYEPKLGRKVITQYEK